MLKVSLGTGILAMPKAFSNAGYLLGVIGTLAVGALSTYTMQMLVSHADNQILISSFFLILCNKLWLWYFLLTVSKDWRKFMKETHVCLTFYFTGGLLRANKVAHIALIFGVFKNLRIPSIHSLLVAFKGWGHFCDFLRLLRESVELLNVLTLPGHSKSQQIAHDTNRNMLRMCYIMLSNFEPLRYNVPYSL